MTFQHAFDSHMLSHVLLHITYAVLRPLRLNTSSQLGITILHTSSLLLSLWSIHTTNSLTGSSFEQLCHQTFLLSAFDAPE